MSPEGNKQDDDLASPLNYGHTETLCFASETSLRT